MIVLIVTLFLAIPQAFANQCTYKVLTLDKTAVPGKICVYTHEPVFKPNYLEFKDGKIDFNPNFTTKCLEGLSGYPDLDARKKNCYVVPNAEALDKLYEQAIAVRQIGPNFVDFYDLTSQTPNWAGLTKRLKEITQDSESSEFASPESQAKD
ncbi:MAG: hypothetical protein AAF203_06875 [Pseudomonadota bacterium]